MCTAVIESKQQTALLTRQNCKPQSFQEISKLSKAGKAFKRFLKLWVKAKVEFKPRIFLMKPETLSLTSTVILSLSKAMLQLEN
jgi:hypothetical protein